MKFFVEAFDEDNEDLICRSEFEIDRFICEDNLPPDDDEEEEGGSDLGDSKLSVLLRDLESDLNILYEYADDTELPGFKFDRITIHNNGIKIRDDESENDIDTNGILVAERIRDFFAPGAEISTTYYVRYQHKA